MSVYVDPLMNHGWRLGPSCHMFADSLDELHAMAAKIGMKRDWFQDKWLPHYDLVASRRERAVSAGAISLPIGKELREAMQRCRKPRPQEFPTTQLGGKP